MSGSGEQRACRACRPPVRTCAQAVAGTPNNSKRFAETRRPSSRSGSPTPVRLKLRSDIAAMPVKTVLASASRGSWQATAYLSENPDVRRSPITSPACSGFLNGSGRSSTALTTLKIALFAPMPRCERENSDARERGILRERAQAVAQSCSEIGKDVDLPFAIPMRSGLATRDAPRVSVRGLTNRTC